MAHIPRRPIPRYGRQLGKYGEYASPAYVPETVRVRSEQQQQQRHEPRTNRPRNRQMEQPLWRG